MGMAARVLFGLVVSAIPSGAQTDAHLYAPGTNLERSEMAQLETATRSIDVAMYSFTDRELAEELAALAHKGVPHPGLPGSRAVLAGDAIWWGDYNQHPAGGGYRGPGQRCKGSHAPQELCRRWASSSLRFC